MATANRRDDDELEENHEINVTPFIDVMLVLLIIFMVAAPLATVDVPVELPAVSAQPSSSDREPTWLTVQRDLSLSLDQDRIHRADLKARLEAATNGDHDQRIFVRADSAVPYGELMAVMNALRDAGYLKVALVGLENSEG